MAPALPSMPAGLRRIYEWRHAGEGAMSRSPFFNQNMRGLLTGDGCDGSEPESVKIEASKEMLPFSQEDRRKSQMDLINQTGGQVLTNRGHTATNPNVFSLGRVFR